MISEKLWAVKDFLWPLKQYCSSVNIYVLDKGTPKVMRKAQDRDVDPSMVIQHVTAAKKSRSAQISQIASKNVHKHLLQFLQFDLLAVKQGVLPGWDQMSLVNFTSKGVKYWTCCMTRRVIKLQTIPCNSLVYVFIGVQWMQMFPIGWRTTWGARLLRVLISVHIWSKVPW